MIRVNYIITDSETVISAIYSGLSYISDCFTGNMRQVANELENRLFDFFQKDVALGFIPQSACTSAQNISFYFDLYADKQFQFEMTGYIENIKVLFNLTNANINYYLQYNESPDFIVNPAAEAPVDFTALSDLLSKAGFVKIVRTNREGFSSYAEVLFVCRQDAKLIVKSVVRCDTENCIHRNSCLNYLYSKFIENSINSSGALTDIKI